MKRYRSPYGDEMTWITGEGDAGGAYCLLERFAPPGARSTPHIHRRLTEAFYVLDGAFEFNIGGETIAGAPGVFVQAAPGIDHAWRVMGDAPARALVLFTPSAHKAYFEEMDAIVAAGPPLDTGALLALAEKYGWT